MLIPQYVRQRRLDPSAPAAFFRNVLKEAIGISGAEEGGVVLRNDRTGELRVEVFIGEGVEYKRRLIEPDPTKSVCAAAAVSKKVQSVPNVEKDPRFHALSNTKVMSELVVPILHGDTCDGLINLESPRLNAFPPNIERTIDAYGCAISANFHCTLIDSHRYFLEEQLAAVQDITELTLLRMESETIVLDRVLEHSLALTEADTGGLLTLSPDREHLELRAHRGLKPECNGYKIPRGNGLVWKCVQARSPQNFWDVHEFGGVFLHLSAPEINSELIVPLSFKNEPFGVINIESCDYNAFSFEHEQMLAMFSQQVSLLLHLTELQKKLSGASALSGYWNLSQNLSHRLNNCIGAANALAKRIETEALDTAVRTVASQIKQCTTNALNVIDEYRRKSECTDELIDVCSVIRDSIAAMSLPDSVRLVLHASERPIRMRAPRLQIAEMCRELIQNSRKSMKDLGEISLNLSLRWGVLVLEVADSGRGFPQNGLDEFFVLGKRGQTDSPGTGYGLSWVQKFVHSLGGEVALQNRPEGGGLVRVMIPCPHQEEGKEEPE